MAIHLLSFYEILVASVFISWFVVTVVCQFSHWNVAARIRSLDFLSLVPLWTFFAPNPGKQDYHLLYRDKQPQGSLGEWVEVDLQEERYLYTCVWNPDKRDKKVLSDIVQNLAVFGVNGPVDLKSLSITLPYLLILKFVCTRELPSTQPAYRQFMLAGSFGYNSDSAPEFIMLSMFHPL